MSVLTRDSLVAGPDPSCRRGPPDVFCVRLCRGHLYASRVIQGGGIFVRIFSTIAALCRGRGFLFPATGIGRRASWGLHQSVCVEKI